MDEAEIYNRQRIAQLELKQSLRETLAKDISHFSEDKKRQIAAQILQLDPRERRDEEIQALKYLTEHLDFFVKINSKKFNQETKLDEKICRRMKYQSSKKGEVVIEYGAKADKFFILLSGEVSIFLMKSPEAIEHEANEQHKASRKMKFTQISHPNEITPNNDEETNKNSNSNSSIADENNRNQPRKSTFLSNKPLPSQRKSSSIQSPFAASEDLSERFSRNKEPFNKLDTENQKDNESQQFTPFNKLLLKMPYLISSNLQQESIIDQSANTNKSMFYNNNSNNQQNLENTPLHPQSQGCVSFFGNTTDPDYFDQRQSQKHDSFSQLPQKLNLTSQDSQKSFLLQQDNSNPNITSKLTLIRKQSISKPSALALVQRVFKHRNFEQNIPVNNTQASQGILLRQNSQCDRNLNSPQTQSSTGEQSSLQHQQPIDRFTFTDALVNQNSNPNFISTITTTKTKLSSMVSRWLEIKHHVEEETTFGGLSLSEIENVERFFTQDSCIFKFSYRDKLQPGSTFGELGILEGKPRSALIVCSADSEFAIMEKKDYSELLAQRDRKHLLQKFSFLKTHLFPDLTNDAIKKIFYSFQKKTLQRNEILFQEGQQANGLFIIKKGEVGLSYKMKMKNPEEIDEGDDGGKDVRDEGSEDLDAIRCKALFYKPAIYTNKTFAVIGRGEYFGEEDMLVKEHQSIRQFTATVISMECSVYFVDANFLMKFLKSKPTSSLIMQERLNRKLKWRRDYQLKANSNIILHTLGNQKNLPENMLLEKQIIQQKLAIISQKNECDLRRKAQQRKQQLQQQQSSQQLSLGRLRCLLQHSSQSSQYLSRESPWNSSKDLFQTQIINSMLSQPTKGNGNTSSQLNLIEEEEQHHGDSSQRQNIKECFTNTDSQGRCLEKNENPQGSHEIGGSEMQKQDQSCLKNESQEKQDTSEQPMIKQEQIFLKPQQDPLKQDSLPDAISYPKDSTLSSLKHLTIQRRPQSQISLRNRCNYSLDQTLPPSDLSITQTPLSNMRETKSICSFLSFKQYFFNRQLYGQSTVQPLSSSTCANSNPKADNASSISDANSQSSKSYPMKHILEDHLKVHSKLSKLSETDISFLPRKLLNSSNKEGNYVKYSKNQSQQFFQKNKLLDNHIIPQSCSQIDIKTNCFETNNSLSQTTKKHRQFSFSLSPSKTKGNIQNSSCISSSQDIILPCADNSGVSGNNLIVTRNQSNNSKTATQITRDSVVAMCLRKIKKKTDSIDSILRKKQAQPPIQQIIKQAEKIGKEQVVQHRSVTPDVSSQDLRIMRKWSGKRERELFVNHELSMNSKLQMMERGKLGRLKVKGATESSNQNPDDSMNNFSVLHFLPISQKSMGIM